MWRLATLVAGKQHVERKIACAIARQAQGARHRPAEQRVAQRHQHELQRFLVDRVPAGVVLLGEFVDQIVDRGEDRSEEHTSELQSLMRISYAVFCLKKKK